LSRLDHAVAFGGEEIDLETGWELEGGEFGFGGTVNWLTGTLVGGSMDPAGQVTGGFRNTGDRLNIGADGDPGATKRLSGGVLLNTGTITHRNGHLDLQNNSVLLNTGTYRVKPNPGAAVSIRPIGANGGKFIGPAIPTPPILSVLVDGQPIVGPVTIPNGSSGTVVTQKGDTSSPYPIVVQPPTVRSEYYPAPGTYWLDPPADGLADVVVSLPLTACERGT